MHRRIANDSRNVRELLYELARAYLRRAFNPSRAEGETETEKEKESKGERGEETDKERQREGGKREKLSVISLASSRTRIVRGIT